MEEINHFSHEEHPLKLIENWETFVAASVFTDDDDDEKKKNVVAECNGCGDSISISGGSAYGCVPCQYFLHKKCAELKPIINHRFHPLHPLTLVNHNYEGFDRWNCDVCGNKYPKECFSYRCSECDFDACTKCGVVDALKEGLSIKLKHEGHHPQHTLTLQSKAASFSCDACHTEEKDYFYKCDDCEFWIHNACTSLAPTIKLPHHHHPLHLVYSLPDSFHKYIFFCEYCEKYILKHYIWLYHCANCRYFAHIKCALDAEHLPISSDVPVDEDQGKGLLQFPMPYAFTDPLKLLHSQNLPQDNDDEIEINHWSHDHPLILIDAADSQGNIINFNGDSDVIKVCSVCVRPLSSPYYTCKLDGCSFSLHKYCAHLPLTLEKHQLHPHDLLHLQRNIWYRCDGCYSWGNTFAYKCKTCKFFLDVNCAFLPENIKHKSHNHSLTLVIDPKLVCKACDKLINVGSCYSCKACNFHLCLFCATRSPTSIGHRYCKDHDIILTYPPVEDHPEDFYCEICEEEMHPKKYPLYYCQICKNSFHLHCLTPIDRFLNVWSDQGTTTESYHKHPLTFVRRKKTPDYVCSKCNVDINGRLILECRSKACNFNICCECHYETYND